MRPSDDSILTPDERRSEVANILAGGVLRLHARAALPNDTPDLSVPKNSLEFAPSYLEVSNETVLTVHKG